MDDVLIGGKKLISVSRAREMSGYTADYIGQLCRGNKISCKSISGQWYVDETSLNVHVKNNKSTAEHSSAGVYTKNIGNVRDDSVQFDGEEYISSARAAEITGYAQDYVGELARKEEIRARKAGRQWFVNKKDLVSHKHEKDSLLASVQSSAAGLQKTDANNTKPETYSLNFNTRYISETVRESLPTVAPGSSESTVAEKYPASTDSDAEPVAIRRAYDSLRDRVNIANNEARETEIMPSLPHTPKVMTKIAHQTAQTYARDGLNQRKTHTSVRMLLVVILVAVSVVAGVLMTSTTTLPQNFTTQLMNKPYMSSFIDVIGYVLPGRTLEYTR